MSVVCHGRGQNLPVCDLDDGYQQMAATPGDPPQLPRFDLADRCGCGHRGPHPVGQYRLLAYFCETITPLPGSQCLLEVLVGIRFGDHDCARRIQSMTAPCAIGEM